MDIKRLSVKRLLIYVFSLFMLLLYTTSCVSYDEDIDDIYKEIEELKNQIADIKNQIETGNYVVSVQTITGGMKVTFNNGSSYDIVNGRDGAKGLDGTQWTIGVDSIWYMNAVKTNPPKRAIGQQGISSPSPEIYKKNESEYYWVVYKWDDTEKDFKADTLLNDPVYSYNTYAVDKGANYELYIWVKDETTPDNSKYNKIILPKNAQTNGAYSLELLGYEQIKSPTRPISLDSLNNNNIHFEYWYLSQFYNATPGSEGVVETWEGRTTVKKKQVLTSLKKDSIAAIIRTTSPKNGAFTLKDSQGKSLPISFETPVKHTGKLTKAGTSDSIYIMQTNGTKNEYANVGEYKAKLDTTVVYALVDTITGIKSNYRAFITPKEGNSSLTQAVTSKIGGDSESADKEYDVVKDPTKSIGITFTNNAYLYDYYVEALDSVTAVDKFGFTVDKKNGTFKVTKADEEIEKFKILIHKLHYNGYIYTDTISIKPL